MRLKSYFAATVETAMAMARTELGPEAMLVQSKRTTTETRHLGHYEVVFALQEGADPAPPEAAPTVPSPNFSDIFVLPRETAIHQLSLELEEMKKRIESMSGVMAHPRSPKAARVPPDPSSGFRRLLEEADVLPDAIDAVLREAKARGAGPDPLATAVESLLRVDAALGVAGASRRIVALVGPPGAGKTTALVKLATRYGLTSRRSMMLISTDVYRVGAAEQLRLYASILGVSFQTVETPLALAQMLEEQRNRDLILIDTPAWAHRDVPEIVEMATYLGSDPDIDVHLVLPASNRACDLARMVDRYSAFLPAKLLFTRLDETDRHGPLLNECHRTGKPVSFLSAGEQIPEDLEPATAARIVELILHRPLSKAAGEAAMSVEERS